MLSGATALNHLVTTKFGDLELVLLILAYTLIDVVMKRRDFCLQGKIYLS